MKNLLLITLILISISLKAQVTSVASKSFGTITDLRAMSGSENVQVLVQGLSTIGDQNGGVYYWNSSATATDDGFTVIKVTNVTTGRWMRMPNSNSIKGSSTFSGTGLVNSFTVTHGLPFTPLQVYIQPRTSNAVQNWIAIGDITATTFKVTFTNIPILGTNNIAFDWLVIKQ